ncbi:MAG: bifunctional DNA primase/polymerase [Pseudonocardiaceae bacterium]
MSTDNPLLSAALAAAARGWAVFPLRPGSKRSALHGDTGRRPCPRTGICAGGHRKWEQRAMTDPDQIRWYWTSRRFTGANIGVATGPSGLVVIDLDLPTSPADVAPESWSRRGAATGPDVFAAVCAEAGHPIPTHTYTVRTARGGRHLYFRAPPGAQLGNTDGEQGQGLGWKVDTRAWGGYVVAPGSITPTGRYHLIQDAPVAELPGWLAHRLTARPSPAVSAPHQIATARLPAYVTAAVAGECHRIATAPPGHGKALFISALALGQLVGAGALPSATAETALHAAATPHITRGCGCTDHEIRRAIHNGLATGATRPRTLPTGAPPA